jgi:hypothetical protein
MVLFPGPPRATNPVLPASMYPEEPSSARKGQGCPDVEKQEHRVPQEPARLLALLRSLCQDLPQSSQLTLPRGSTPRCSLPLAAAAPRFAVPAQNRTAPSARPHRGHRPGPSEAPLADRLGIQGRRWRQVPPQQPLPRCAAALDDQPVGSSDIAPQLAVSNGFAVCGPLPGRTRLSLLLPSMLAHVPELLSPMRWSRRTFSIRLWTCALVTFMVAP